MTHWMRTAFIVALKLHVSQAGWDDWVQNDGAVSLLSFLAGLAGGLLLLLLYACHVRHRSATLPKKHTAPFGPVGALQDRRRADNDDVDEDDDAARGGGSKHTEAEKGSLRSNGLSSAQNGISADRMSCGWSTETLMSRTLPPAIDAAGYESDAEETAKQPAADSSSLFRPPPLPPPPPPPPNPIDHSSQLIAEPLHAEPQSAVATDQKGSQCTAQKPGDPDQLCEGVAETMPKDSVIYEYTHLLPQTKISMAGPHDAAAAENDAEAGAAPAPDKLCAQAESNTAPDICDQASLTML